ncbi:bifunctional phosphoribosyl-AMP cyclohydrolase/phosphoribosyl-ATP diphosphatase HisIE [Marininema halotolerans]|uniref:Histidine biosynthesis bifunctional protein HisIE n=1 Tax=Marininema halotolerans TaxID=1155944 RepID=A0A1I6NXA1_9BACL|nr:bifunctional phosphoribosyl-AMP cyclohydrolase/phosphoribosyl-ATP diphosphatase HisIE [Marininema halotolerans]SFS32468.1 phosphoribosyl-ATP pyrophosphohydrolase / phosphoribosyl-AMP cyclohydrolase [Marininema halotolerans]
MTTDEEKPLSLDWNQLRFDENGLIPAIVQDATSKEVLTLAYMNKEAIQKTLETRETWFWSRSRQELWHKGETSGNTQSVRSVCTDCDQDALLVRVLPTGPACHTGEVSCFPNDSDLSDRYGILTELESVVAAREIKRPKDSYTTYLFDEGVDKILKKVGEEASEVIIAAKNGSTEELAWEISDLFFHLIVLMREQGLSMDQVLTELRKRHHQ